MPSAATVSISEDTLEISNLLKKQPAPLLLPVFSSTVRREIKVAAIIIKKQGLVLFCAYGDKKNITVRSLLIRWWMSKVATPPHKSHSDTVNKWHHYDKYAPSNCQFQINLPITADRWVSGTSTFQHRHRVSFLYPLPPFKMLLIQPTSCSCGAQARALRDDLHHRHQAYMLMKSYQRIILANWVQRASLITITIYLHTVVEKQAYLSVLRDKARSKTFIIRPVY